MDASTIFSDAEWEYLSAKGRLGRLATVNGRGAPQIRPLGFRLNPDGTIDIGGPDHASTRRYRNVLANPLVSFVVDDLAPDEPGSPRPGWGRGVEIRGRAETLAVEIPPVAPEWFSHDVIRIHPSRVLSWNIDPAQPGGQSRDIP